MVAPTPNIHLLAGRVSLIEQRLAELENSYGETLYRLRRESVESKLGIQQILQHLNLPTITSEECPCSRLAGHGGTLPAS